MRAGMASSINASRDAAPTAFSIAAVSSASGPMWRDWNVSKSKTMECSAASGGAVRSLLDEVLILGGVEQRASLAGVRQPDDDHPARVRVDVHRLRLVFERRVHFDDFTCYR